MIPRGPSPNLSHKSLLNTIQTKCYTDKRRSIDFSHRDPYSTVEVNNVMKKLKTYSNTHGK